MSIPPSPSGRGEVTIQPSYFTSSLFVNPLRKDILRLIQAYNESYALHSTEQPFGLFKTIWSRQGWPWMHLKVLDARGRESFLNVVCRLFLERVVASEPAMSRVVGLFGFYCFFMAQPSTSTPPTHRVLHIPIPLDTYESLLALPSALASTPPLVALRPHTKYITSTLVAKSVFHILPASNLQTQNPRVLPREIVHGDQNVAESSSKKKAGRPSKAERSHKAKAVLAALDRWLGKSCYPAPEPTTDPAGAHTVDYVAGDRVAGDEQPGCSTTHIILSQRPIASLNHYRALKAQLLASLDTTQSPSASVSFEDELIAALGGSDRDERASLDKRTVPDALARANAQVLARLKQIDTLAAERGLEVGGEGGDRTGLCRVERAVNDLRNDGKGILGLLEGGGLVRPTAQARGEDDIAMEVLA